MAGMGRDGEGWRREWDDRGGGTGMGLRGWRMRVETVEAVRAGEWVEDRGWTGWRGWIGWIE